VLFSALLEGDLEAIGDYIAADNPERAVSFVRQLKAQCLKVGQNPLRYRLRPEIGADVRLVSMSRYTSSCTASWAKSSGLSGWCTAHGTCQRCWTTSNPDSRPRWPRRAHPLSPLLGCALRIWTSESGIGGNRAEALVSYPEIYPSHPGFKGSRPMSCGQEKSLER
jgi:plasmid stabilization system protein ParE